MKVDSNSSTLRTQKKNQDKNVCFTKKISKNIQNHENNSNSKKKGRINLIKNSKIIFNLMIILIIILCPKIYFSLHIKIICQSRSSYILLKFKNVGPQYVVSKQYYKAPDKIYINDIEIEKDQDEPKKIMLNNINDIIKIEFDEDIDKCIYMFQYLINLSYIDLSNFYSSKVTNTGRMFLDCISLTSIKFGNFDTSLVSDMSRMFLNCSSLTTLDISSFDTSSSQSMELFISQIPGITSLDVSNLKTSSVITMRSMFQGLKNLKFLDLSNFDTSKVIDMAWMFSEDRNLEYVNLSNFDTSLVQNFQFLFQFCEKMKEIHISHFVTSSAKTMQAMFRGCLTITELDITNFDTRNVENMNYMFLDCRKLTSLNVSSFDTSKVIDMNSMFKSLQSIKEIDVSNFDLRNVVTIRNMFAECVLLTSLNLSNFYTPKVKDMNGFLSYCKSLKSVDISNLKTSLVTDFTGVFEHDYVLTSVDLSNFDTSSAQKFSRMFKECKQLTSLNISHFDTTRVIDMSEMLYNCAVLTSINLSNFNVEKVQTLKSMFEGCSSMTTLYIFNFYTKSATDLSRMFANCRNMEYINFYNYIEVDNSKFNDIIYGTRSDIVICINVNETHRMYHELIDKSILRCFLKEEINGLTTIIDIAQNAKTSINQIIETTELIEKGSTYLINNLKSSVVENKKIELSTGIPLNDVTTNIPENLDESNKINTSIATNYKNESESELSKISSSSNAQSNEIETNLISISSELTTKNELLESDKIFKDNIEIYNHIINSMLQNYIGNINQPIFIKGNNNFVFSITTDVKENESLKRKTTNNQTLSIIDLGECKNKLIERYFPGNENISFIIIKHEKLTTNHSEKIIQYEVYEPFNYTKLDLSICEEAKINIYIPVQLSKKTEKLIEDLKKLGYDIFNINDPFYTDFCTQYTTPDGTDISLEDRKKYIYESIMNEISCQENCDFSNYYPESRNIECKCKADGNINTVDYKDFSWKKLHHTFYDVLKYSNYKVIFCYKLVFDTAIFSYNKGFWLLFILFLLYLTQLFTYLRKVINPLKLHIARYYFKNKQIPIKMSEKKYSVKSQFFNTEQKNMDSESFFPPKKIRSSVKPILTKITEKKNKEIKFNLDIKEKIDEKYIRNKKKIVRDSTKTMIGQDESTNRQTLENISADLIRKNLDNFELNNLEYEEALIFDKRYFYQTYCSILKREHSIIFTFFYCNDYNLYYVKLARFFFLLATDLAMNVFFFADETMNKLYLSYGKYDFVQQIPQIIYSKIVSNLIEVFICYLSLTDKHYYEIKTLDKSDKVKIFNNIKCVKKKLIIFFIFTFLSFLFYIYLVTAFCAVYKNTQIVYIKDSAYSFLLGIIYPFILYLLPSLLRIISLRCKCCDLKCLYSLSEMIPIF